MVGGGGVVEGCWSGLWRGEKMLNDHLYITLDYSYLIDVFAFSCRVKHNANVGVTVA